MSEALTKDELLILQHLVAEEREGTDVPAYCEELTTMLTKLRGGAAACDERAEQVGSVRSENFPQTIDFDEATQYDKLGQRLILQGAGLSVPEGRHAKLSSIMIGLTSALCQVMKMPREPFCNTLVTNVMFAALKAAYNEGGGPILDGPNSGSTAE